MWANYMWMYGIVSASMNKNEAFITEKIQEHVSSCMCLGQDRLLVDIQPCQRFRFQATSERPLMTECFNPNRRLYNEDRRYDSALKVKPKHPRLSNEGWDATFVQWELWGTTEISAM